MSAKSEYPIFQFPVSTPKFFSNKANFISLTPRLNSALLLIWMSSTSFQITSPSPFNADEQSSSSSQRWSNYKRETPSDWNITSPSL